ncbi:MULTISPECIES: autotransporter [unclassified Pantoea]|uniref:autotransporter n=1 Tax=unclassified Pantoea TaxID=2630326 RepID=UPI0012329E9B|nr:MULTISPECIES: autotransporter [unclassified Pantoea]KAA5969933.1 autotransporter [Pantoea sp. M_6]KAA5973780.1 autotransporter [Pantoea sp. M_8]KAA5988443.1 autotransporter [Pantoea sp. M_10]KAA5996227.1 autotransporter [Pantoea sp. M_5]
MSPKSGWKGLRTCCAAWLLILMAPAFARSGLSAPPHADFLPDYDTILAEKIALTPLTFNDENRALFEAAINSPTASPIALHSETGSAGTTPLGKRYRAGVEMPVAPSLTTGPVAQYAVDPQPINCLQCDYSDQQSREQSASVGWRIDSQQGWISPWAQLSYRYLLAETPQTPRREATNGPDQSEGIDLSIGAQLPLNDNLAAFASFSQNEALNNQEQQLYSFGFSASF